MHLSEWKTMILNVAIALTIKLLACGKISNWPKLIILYHVKYRLGNTHTEHMTDPILHS